MKSKRSSERAQLAARSGQWFALDEDGNMAPAVFWLAKGAA